MPVAMLRNPVATEKGARRAATADEIPIPADRVRALAGPVPYSATPAPLAPTSHIAASWSTLWWRTMRPKRKNDFGPNAKQGLMQLKLKPDASRK